MLILVLILCLATSLYVALRRKDSLSLYLLGMSVCNLVMFAGIIVYIAAIGGTSATAARTYSPSSTLTPRTMW